MADVNLVVVSGKVMERPTLRENSDGKKVAFFRLAVRPAAKSGVAQPATVVEVEAFSRAAEIIDANLRKGREVLVQGKLHAHEWKLLDGSPFWRLRVLLTSFEMLGDGVQLVSAEVSTETRTGSPEPIDVKATMKRLRRTGGFSPASKR